MFEAVPFQWQEDNLGRFGDGISRPIPKIKTRQYRVVVYPSGARPLTWTTNAESRAHAIKYAQARWPNAAVEGA
jgi:hypothetical protein